MGNVISSSGSAKLGPQNLSSLDFARSVLCQTTGLSEVMKPVGWSMQRMKHCIIISRGVSISIADGNVVGIGLSARLRRSAIVIWDVSPPSPHPSLNSITPSSPTIVPTFASSSPHCELWWFFITIVRACMAATKASNFTIGTRGTGFLGIRKSFRMRAKLLSSSPRPSSILRSRPSLGNLMV